MEKVWIIISNFFVFICKNLLLPIGVSMITTITTMNITEKRNRASTLPQMSIFKISSKGMLQQRKNQLPQDKYIMLKYASDKEQPDGAQEVIRRPAPRYTELKNLEYEKVCRQLQSTSFVILGVENISGKEVTLSRLINDIGQGQDLDPDWVPLFANGKGGYCLVFSEQDKPYEITGYMGETPITYSTNNCESGKIRATVKETKKRLSIMRIVKISTIHR